MTEIQTHFIDQARRLVIPGDHEQSLIYCTEQFIKLANDAIHTRGKFAVALSGGSTPKAIFQKICNPPYIEQINWSRVWLFWSDERSVKPTDPESNYHMAMKAGFEHVPIPESQIIRMVAEENIERNAEEYHDIIETELGDSLFDLVMLGMGDDGHIASLFPQTEALTKRGVWACPNYIPQKKTWRMTLTYECINQSSHIFLYVLGEKKQDILLKVLKPTPGQPPYPAQLIGTSENPALWIADKAAAQKIFSNEI